MRDGVTRRGDTVIAGGMLWRYFDKTQCRQGVEAFFDRDVEGTPAGSEMLDDLIGEHDDERMGPGAGFAAYEDGAHFEVRSFAGPKRGLNRRQIFVTVVDHLFGGLRGRQVGFEHRAAIEVGGFLLRVLKDRQRDGTLLDGQLDPVRDAQGCGAGYELLPSHRGLGARMVGEVLIVLGNQRLERRQFRAPGVR